jgi:hypothetical protein
LSLDCLPFISWVGSSNSSDGSAGDYAWLGQSFEKGLKFSSFLIFFALPIYKGNKFG